MAVLEKIRVKFGILITVLVALALLSFILDPQTLRSAADRFSSDNKVGSMNGKSISYREFYEELNNITEVAKLGSRASPAPRCGLAVDFRQRSLHPEGNFRRPGCRIR